MGLAGRAVGTALRSRGQQGVQWALHSAVGASRACSGHCPQQSGPEGRAVGTALRSRGQQGMPWALPSAVGAIRACSGHCTQQSDTNMGIAKRKIVPIIIEI